MPERSLQPPMSQNDDLQRKAIEAEYLRVQTDQIQKQIGQLQQAASELRATQNAMDHAPLMKQGVLFPVGSGVFAKAAVQKPDEMLVDLGARTLVQKNPGEVKKILENRLQAVEQSLDELASAYTAGQERMESLAHEMQRLSRER